MMQIHNFIDYKEIMAYAVALRFSLLFISNYLNIVILGINSFKYFKYMTFRKFVRFLE